MTKREQQYERELERFQLVISQSHSMFVFMDPEGYIEYINDRLTEILGYSKEDLIGINYDFTSPDEEGRKYYEQIANALNTHGHYSGELKVRKKDGSKLWVKASMTIIFKNGSPDCMVAVMDDITSEVELKRQHHDSEEMMKNIVDNATISITLMDWNGRFTYFNSQAVKNLGYPPDQLKDKTVVDIFPVEGPATLETVRMVFKEKRPFMNEVSYPIDGRMRTFEINRLPLFDHEGNVSNVMSIAREITESKYAEKLSGIYNTIDSLQSIGESFDQSIDILFDNLFKLEWVDGAGLYLMDYDEQILELIYHRGLSEEFIKNVRKYPFSSPNVRTVLQNIPRYVTTDNYLTSSKENIIKEKVTFVASLPLVYKEKVLGLLNLASRKVTGIDLVERTAIETIALKIGNLLELIKTRTELDRSNTELTNRLKELSINQQILIQKSRLESLGELSAGLAHEINQPLSVISLVMENVNYKLGMKATTEEYLLRKFNTISQNINKIRELIDHVRIFSRDQGTLMFERVDVNNVINNALSMIGSQLKNRQIQVVTELADIQGYTLGNPSRFEQVILNLISNARDALEEKQKLPGNQGQPINIRISTRVLENLIQVNVWDNGTGISPENLQRIFNPFFTTKSTGHGTGLGLPIVYGIINEMKGEINARSEKGSFTEVIITLPLYKNVNENN